MRIRGASSSRSTKNRGGVALGIRLPAKSSKRRFTSLWLISLAMTLGMTILHWRWLALTSDVSVWFAEPDPAPRSPTSSLPRIQPSSSVDTGIGGSIASSPNATMLMPRDWCEKVRRAREGLAPALLIAVPCERMAAAKSAVVCMLTDGAKGDRTSKVVFAATDYVHGAMALGASLESAIDTTQTHRLLLLREGFILSPDDKVRLEAVGWTIGTAPNLSPQQKHAPRFERYKTTYTKISSIGLEEYDCVLQLDADTLAVGDLRELMSCGVFKEPQQRLGGVLDLFKKKWHFFNSGAVLWKPAAMELQRVISLTEDSSFMKAFTGDQDFLNEVYPERLNDASNQRIAEGQKVIVGEGKVVDLGWGYNAQTHVEVHLPEYWNARRSEVRILHFTEKKGWQCEERHEAVPTNALVSPSACLAGKRIPMCFCHEAHWYWNHLARAHALATQKLGYESNSLHGGEW